MVDRRALVVEHLASTLKERGGGDILLGNISVLGIVESGEIWRNLQSLGMFHFSTLVHDNIIVLI